MIQFGAIVHVGYCILRRRRRQRRIANIDNRYQSIGTVVTIANVGYGRSPTSAAAATSRPQSIGTGFIRSAPATKGATPHVEYSVSWAVAAAAILVLVHVDWLLTRTATAPAKGHLQSIYHLEQKTLSVCTQRLKFWMKQQV
ncbi:hypothetical protein Y032_0414g1051 [Ancylostoma ceylanicum]|uniref:Uncharacterized protein n=1 Tax=Ancylostoma ceylanicum TaxID=53326 RepID=A0A016X214_9BILA|nr:hypothetical protein Y032_0414g1051 [Ancylostoma ceylanicum]